MESMDQIIRKIDALVDTVEDRTCLPADPLVSVCMTTYNHEKFIAQALDGILMQEVDFPHEVVIGEDCSTDRTRAIVCDYQRRHPDKIRLRLSRENLYSQKLKPGLGVLRACRGKYIALCEGDDYWTDPLKLQKQVDFLEAHPECAMCFHERFMVDSNGVLIPISRLPAGMKRSLSRSEIIRWRYPLPPTCTVMYRKRHIADLPDWIRKVDFGDRVTVLTATQYGQAGYVEGIKPSMYRVHAGGVNRGNSDAVQKLQMIQFCRVFFECAAKTRSARRHSIEKMLDTYIRHGLRLRNGLNPMERSAEWKRFLGFVIHNPVSLLYLLALAPLHIFREMGRMLVHAVVVVLQHVLPHTTYAGLKHRFRRWFE
jgi:glycosyltransferase involved in cell wall biosynthesis